MKNNRKLLFFVLFLIIVPLALLGFSSIGKTEVNTTSNPLPERYQTFIYPLLPHPIDATLESRYPVSAVPQNKEDLTIYEKKWKVINALRIVYRNNTSQKLHDPKINLHIKGMYLNVLLSTFSTFSTPNNSQRIVIVPSDPNITSGKPYITELYFYAPQRGTAKVFAEISTREGHRIKTNTLTVGAE